MLEKDEGVANQTFMFQKVYQLKKFSGLYTKLSNKNR